MGKASFIHVGKRVYPLQKRPVIQIAFSVSLLAGATFSVGSKASVFDDERFFETKVRPLLVARCYECHSEEISEAGLRLDSHQSVLKKGLIPTMLSRQ